MDEQLVVRTIRDHVAATFPKECTCCGKKYDSFGDYLRNTKPIGKPISYDAERGDWRPDNPAGTLAMANCSCGTTLILGTAGMDKKVLWNLMEWAKKETESRGITVDELLEQVRRRIAEMTLGPDADVAGR